MLPKGGYTLEWLNKKTFGGNFFFFFFFGGGGVDSDLFCEGEKENANCYFAIVCIYMSG